MKFAVTKTTTMYAEIEANSIAELKELYSEGVVDEAFTYMPYARKNPIQEEYEYTLDGKHIYLKEVAND